MGMPELAERYWTAADVRALPDDGKRYECIDGELLVTPAPRGLHQVALSDLFDRVSAYVRDNRLGRLLWSPADIEIEPGTLLQPDLFVAKTIRVENSLRDWVEITGLRLAIEVLSPSTARYDRVVKRDFYQRSGVEEYWIVDLDARLIERWRPGRPSPEVLTERLIWAPQGAAAPLEIDLTSYFASLGDERRDR
jgi:Uma2 family endonuclease